MTYRYYLTILSSRVEVFPLNFLKTSLVDKKGSGEIFYRRTFNGTLRFYCNTKTGTTDFELLYLVEQVDNCTDLVLDIEQKDSAANTYHNYWTGHFSTVDGMWDLDKSTFDVTPKPYDNYYNFDIDGDTQYNIIAGVPAKVTCNTATKPEDYTRCMFVVDVLEYLVQQVFTGATVTSWFLNNADNPVIGGVNKWRYLTILQKSDAKRPDATNPATMGMLSLSELMYILRVMYNIYWTYDGTTVRIEHYSYWDSVSGLDLRTQAISQRQNKYAYLKNDMPHLEKFNFMEAEDNNYTEHIIKYNENCTVTETSVEYSVNVTTDIEMIETAVSDQQLSPNEGLINNISDDGWVILSNELTGGVYNVYYGAAYESGDASYNYCNSWSYLLRAFHLHNRVLMSGWINSTAINFISARKIIRQEIKAIVCYEDNYSPEDYITTELGETYLGSKKGYVDQATIHPDGHVEFALLYGEDTDETAEMPAAPKSINIVYHSTAPLNTCFYLSEPNIYDTYIYIRLNGTECTEIIILAGTVYQCETLNDPGAPVASYEFNIEDPSLDGWSVFVNGGMVYTRINNASGCPAVPPVPPAVPDPVVMNEASQFDVCGEVYVDWDASITGATYYRLYRKPNQWMVNAYGLITSTPDDYYNDFAAGLEGGTTFYYKVYACNISGCSAESNEVNCNVIC
jgi:hypothetical protein